MDKELFFQAMRVVWQWARESVEETASRLVFLWTRQKKPRRLSETIWQTAAAERVIAQCVDTHTA